MALLLRTPTVNWSGKNALRNLTNDLRTRLARGIQSTKNRIQTSSSALPSPTGIPIPLLNQRVVPFVSRDVFALIGETVRSIILAKTISQWRRKENSGCRTSSINIFSQAPWWWKDFWPDLATELVRFGEIKVARNSPDSIQILSACWIWNGQEVWK